MSTTDFKHFCLNLDGLDDRNTEHPSKAQSVIKGEVFRHHYDESGTDPEDSIVDCYVVAIERQPLIDYFKALFYENPDDPNASIPIVNTYAKLQDLTESDIWDPDDQYAAIVVIKPIV